MLCFAIVTGKRMESKNHLSLWENIYITIYLKKDMCKLYKNLLKFSIKWKKFTQL